MKLTDLLGKNPRKARSIEDVQAAGVSVRKEKRDKLSTSDKLKLSKAAREGGVTNLRSSLQTDLRQMSLSQCTIYKCKSTH